MKQKLEPGILKSYGGKAKQVADLASMLPREGFTRFVDPFVGGASFPAYLRDRGFTGPMLLADVNRPLMAVHRQLQADVEALIRELEPMRSLAGREVFNAFRLELDATFKPQVGLLAGAGRLSRLEVALRWIYLNRRTFSGISRVNLEGWLNMPWGEDQALPAEKTLRRFAALLQGAELYAQDFDATLDLCRPGDFVLFDPPYIAPDGKAAFTAYAGKFGLSQQRRLEERARELDSMGIRWMACNADCTLARTIWKRWRIEPVKVRRNGNSDGKGRGAVGELRIFSYDQ